jgi:hypothetical protein
MRDSAAFSQMASIALSWRAPFVGPANNDATSDCAGVAWLSVTNGSSAQLALLVCRPHKQNLMKRGHAASFVTRMPLLEIRLTFDVFHGCRFNHWGPASSLQHDAAGCVVAGTSARHWSARWIRILCHSPGLRRELLRTGAVRIQGAITLPVKTVHGVPLLTTIA